MYSNVYKYIDCIYRKGGICKIEAKKVKCEFFLKGTIQNFCIVGKIIKQIKNNRSDCMILLDDNKKIEDLNKSESLKFEVMKTIAVAKGINVYNPAVSVDFTSNSNFSKAANLLLSKFDIKLKKKVEEKEEEEIKTDIEDEEDILDDEELDALEEDDVDEDEEEVIEKPKKKKKKKKKVE